MPKSTDGRNGNQHVEQPEESPGGAGFARLSLAEVRQLIALINGSDLSEIAIERPSAGLRLVLRRTVEPTVVVPQTTTVTEALMVDVIDGVSKAHPALSEPVREYVTAPLVGTFQPTLKKGQKPLVSVGDNVREGQVVGSIETLRVINEVESQVSGRVVEIFVTPGQPVEYGQRLMALVPEGSHA